MSLPQYWRLFAVIAIVSIAGLTDTELSCAAEQHLVGDDRGWDSFSDLRRWTSGRTFSVGDNLWFAYSAERQSVIELKSQEEWEACDIRNPLGLYDKGLDVVRLSEAGSRYFTSGRVEDCQDGMKLHVNVVSGEDSRNGSNHNNGGSPSLPSASSSSSDVKELLIGMVVAEGPTFPGDAPPVASKPSMLNLWFACLVALLLSQMV